ncbi:MAG: hypothetical protein ABIH23_23940 [bacterium]
MGTYLTDEHIERIKEELSLVYALPYANDLVGTAWEQILAGVKGGTWTDLRDNRPRPDFVVRVENREINYSVKTEGLRPTSERRRAIDFLGTHEDLIVARPKVDELLGEGESIDALSADSLGAKVLEYYNEHIVRKFRWDVISILLRIGSREFIYWEESPPALYNPADYWWKESGRATGSNRNINGYPQTVARDSHTLPRAKFKWTSGGKQFYVLYEIPPNADTWDINPIQLTLEEVRAALREKLRAKKRILGQESAT